MQPTQSLTADEQKSFAACEKIISAGLKTFSEVGNALLKIRDSRLYRASFPNFERYCLEKWGFARRRAEQICSAAEVINQIAADTNNCSHPQNEAQVRPLHALDTPEQKVQAWQKAQEKAQSEGQPVTAKHVEAAVEEIKPKTEDDKWKEALGGTIPIIEVPKWNPGQTETELDGWLERTIKGRTPEEMEQLHRILNHAATRVRVENKPESKIVQLPPLSSNSDNDIFISDLAQLNGKKFSCIYADPPWKYSNQGTRASTDNHYSTMTVEEIAVLPIGELAEENCHLHLWTTNAFLFECPKIFAAWGFEFKSSFVWVKPQMGIGNYWRNSHEVLLLAVKGSMTAKARNLRSWAEISRGAHSVKPDQVRHMIEQISPGPYLELFGRRYAKGWTVFGNELLESQTELAAV